MESNVAFGSGAVDRSDPAKVRIEYIAEVFQENKIVCLREISVFIGSGRSEKIKSRLEFAQSRHCLLVGVYELDFNR